eukprot:2507988-Amphidinium_carterae.1
MRVYLGGTEGDVPQRIFTSQEKSFKCCWATPETEVPNLRRPAGPNSTGVVNSLHTLQAAYDAWTGGKSKRPLNTKINLPAGGGFHCDPKLSQHGANGSTASTDRNGDGEEIAEGSWGSTNPHTPQEGIRPRLVRHEPNAQESKARGE